MYPLNKLKAFLLIAAGLLIGTELHGQAVDSLQKNSIRYFSPGNGGRNKVWDFSKKLSSKGSAQVMFLTDSTGVVTVVETGKISYVLNLSLTIPTPISQSPPTVRLWQGQRAG